VLDPRAKVRVGVSVNNLTGITGHRYEITDLLRLGTEAEAMGFDGVWVHDAPLGRRTVAAYDPVNLLTAIAARTERLFLATGVVMPHLRNPVSFAASWATLDKVSGGRSILGVGTGAGKARLVEREYQAAGALRPAGGGVEPSDLYKNRGRIFEESVDIVRRLWWEDKVTYEGEFYRFQDVTLGAARPETPPPILIGAGIYYPKNVGGPVHHDWGGDKAGTFRLGPYKRVATLGDGWITPHATPQEYDESWSKIETYASNEGIDRQYIKAFNCFVNINDDPRKAWEEVKAHLEGFHGPPVGEDVVDRWGFTGTAEDVAARLRHYIDQGVTVLQLVVGTHEQERMMKRIAQQLLPLLKG
jgi:coenzyme F420-dependent glucose-6-phosphate dehydrogenase